MAGYIHGATAQVRPLGDVITLMDSFSAGRKLPLKYYAFGQKIAPITAAQGGPRAYATAKPYECATCDRTESRIDSVLEAIKSAKADTLNVVVSDLWLDNKSFVASQNLALGLPLTQMLREGRAIGILGTRAPFSGAIYDLPSGRRHQHTGEHPLFVLLIGPEAEVQRAYVALTQQGSPSFGPDRTRYSLFSTQPGDAWTPVRPSSASGGGVVQGAVVETGLAPDWVRQYEMGRSTASAQKGEVFTVINSAQGVGPGAVWSGPPLRVDRVWKLSSEKALKACATDPWTPLSSLTKAWSETPNGGHRLSFSPATAPSLPPGTYFVAGYVGTTAVQAPNPANAWMREWSFTPAQEAGQINGARPLFKTLNLADIPDLLEKAINDAAPQGRVLAASGFLVKVER